MCLTEACILLSSLRTSLSEPVSSLRPQRFPKRFVAFSGKTQTPCGDHLSPRRFPRAFFPNRRRGKYIQDRPWKRSLYTGWEQHYVQGPSRSMLPPLLGTQAMPKATAISTCEHRAPAQERLGFYVATCCAMELAIAPFSHGRLHRTPRSSNQPVGIYSYCRCTWDDE